MDVQPAVLDVATLANFGFAALVAGFVLIRLESALKELRDSVRDDSKITQSGNESVRDAVKDMNGTIVRLTDALNRQLPARPPPGS